MRSGGFDTIPPRNLTGRGVKAMPNLLLVISGACIVAYVLRKTLEDLQKKMNDHDGNHGRSDKQG